MPPSDERAQRDPGKALRDAGRAFGGALVFSLPMLMTMEMWWLGFYGDRLRLTLLLLITIPLLMGLSRQIGFESTSRWRDDLFDSLLALGIGAAASAVLLLVFGVVGPGMSLDEVVGKIGLQAVPASIGAMLARSQLGSRDEAEPVSERRETYGGEMLLMAIGALFLGFNVAPTEEMVLISYQMSAWHGLALILLSLAVMHGFVFAVGFRGGSDLSPETPWWSAFLRFTLPGYAIALSISLYVLWTFGRTDDAAVHQILMAMIVLGFPSSVGAAAARLIL